MVMWIEDMKAIEDVACIWSGRPSHSRSSCTWEIQAN
jgi:hypothetical protein